MVPVVNENDAIADDEIRFGDNDRLAALVAHLIRADLLVLLTDAPGLLTADPRFDASASLIEEIVEVDHGLEALAGGAGSDRGSGGMASKLAAAKIAAWSGVRAVIAAGHPGRRAGRGGRRRGRRRHGRAARDQPAARPQALDRLRGRVLPAPSSSTTAPGTPWSSGACRCSPPAWSGSRAGSASTTAVEIAGPDGIVFAKGLTRFDAAGLRAIAGAQTHELPDGSPHEVVHRDDLVVLP